MQKNNNLNHSQKKTDDNNNSINQNKERKVYDFKAIYLTNNSAQNKSKSSSKNVKQN
jgi:hypothetical protein